MNNNEFKAPLELRVKPKFGKNMEVLQQRLILAINAPICSSPVQIHKSMTGLNVTAQWVLLQPNPTPIPNLTNLDVHL